MTAPAYATNAQIDEAVLELIRCNGPIFDAAIAANLSALFVLRPGLHSVGESLRDIIGMKETIVVSGAFWMHLTHDKSLAIGHHSYAQNHTITAALSIAITVIAVIGIWYESTRK